MSEIFRTCVRIFTAAFFVWIRSELLLPLTIGDRHLIARKGMITQKNGHRAGQRAGAIRRCERS
jgi:hypothetical protein